MHAEARARSRGRGRGRPGWRRRALPGRGRRDVAWFGFDGFVDYPAEGRRLRERRGRRRGGLTGCRAGRRGDRLHRSLELPELALEVRQRACELPVVHATSVSAAGAQAAETEAPPSTSTAMAAVSVGVRPTRTPLDSSARAFAAAVPEEPDTIAPAWPICLPAGAVKPAM